MIITTNAILFIRAGEYLAGDDCNAAIVHMCACVREQLEQSPIIITITTTVNWWPHCLLGLLHWRHTLGILNFFLLLLFPRSFTHSFTNIAIALISSFTVIPCLFSFLNLFLSLRSSSTFLLALLRPGVQSTDMCTHTYIQCEHNDQWNLGHWDAPWSWFCN